MVTTQPASPDEPRWFAWLAERWRFVAEHWRPIVLVLALIVGLLGSSLWRVEEMGYVISYVSLVVISYMASHWYIGFFDIVVAAAWLIPFEQWNRVPSLRQGMVFLNRQFGRIVPLVLTLVLAATVQGAWFQVRGVMLPGARFQLPLLVLVLAYGPRLVDRLAVALGICADHVHPDGHFIRRPLYYTLTILTSVILLVRAPTQWRELCRMFVLIWLATSLRGLRWFLTWRHKDAPTGLAAFRMRLLVWSRRLDRLVAIAAVLAFMAPFIRPIRGFFETGDRWRRELVLQSCDRSYPALRERINVFIVSDNQFHELRGQRVGGHLDLVDDVVPVAVRPVELDLLSGVTLGWFADAYARLPKDANGKTWWTHLGDVGDLACRGELRRFGPYVDAFGRDTLAALVPGNHDSTFTGNFSWHPDWDRACAPEGILHKNDSDKLLASYQPGAPVRFVPHPISDWTGIHRSALVSVRELGQTSHGLIVGVFLDTSDYTGFVLGLAGTQGGVSTNQIKEINQALADVRTQHPKQDFWLVLFMHHPWNELSLLSHWHIGNIGCANCKVIGMVSAHTHLAAYRDDHSPSEFVVGSTTDPPQEASLLEIGENAAGEPALRLHTLPAVERDDLVCGPEGTGLRAGECSSITRALEKDPDCDELFHDLPVGRAPWHPPTPESLRKDQQWRASRLLQCVCRGHLCDLPGDPWQKWVSQPMDDPRLFDRIDQLALPPAGDAVRQARRKELVCFSWAASIVQGRKNEGWRFNRALRMGFDASAALGAISVP